MVEFAVVLPVMLLILAGIIEFGRIGSLGLRIAHAARVGAQYGSLNPPDDFTLSDWSRLCEQRVRESLAAQPDIDPGRVTVQCMHIPGSPLGRAHVEVQYSFSLLMGWTTAPGSLTIQRVAVLPVIR
jgi:hypothetical protein